jgi:hypothetical protein
LLSAFLPVSPLTVHPIIHSFNLSFYFYHAKRTYPTKEERCMLQFGASIAFGKLSHYTGWLQA